MRYREYGRSVLKMIDYVSNLEEGEKKDEAIKALVTIMGLVSGMSVKDSVSYHKLWDHLLILSEFRLDSAWPFSVEELEELKSRSREDVKETVERLPYKDSSISQRHYGVYLESMMKKLKEMPDGEEYDELSTLIAQQAKRVYMVWNGDLSDDDIIINQMSHISNDSRVEDRMKGKSIDVNLASLPVEAPRTKKKKKKNK